MALDASVHLVLVLDVNRILIHDVAVHSGHGHLCQVRIEARLRWFQVDIRCILADFRLLLLIQLLYVVFWALALGYTV